MINENYEVVLADDNPIRPDEYVDGQDFARYVSSKSTKRYRNRSQLFFGKLATGGYIDIFDTYKTVLKLASYVPDGTTSYKCHYGKCIEVLNYKEVANWIFHKSNCELKQ